MEKNISNILVGITAIATAISNLAVILYVNNVKKSNEKEIDLVMDTMKNCGELDVEIQKYQNKINKDFEKRIKHLEKNAKDA